jgi:peptidoglycan hydrolase-like protein with peptidoglycan-binding domain
MDNRRGRVFARMSTLAVTGALFAMPTAALARFGDQTLATGSQGHDVRVLQSWLDKLGFSTDVDGAFGRHTRWALRRWEQSKGLPINGVLTRSDARIMRAAMDARYGNGGNGVAQDNPTQTAPGSEATMASDGLHAVAPADAPPAVQAAIDAGNRIVGKPYKYGGGHGQWEDSGYDCSGTVSYALHGAGLLNSPLTSGDFESWGSRGRGQWITIYAASNHVYAIIAGLRLDTSGSGGKGPRWHTDLRTGDGYVVRHPSGL